MQTQWKLHWPDQRESKKHNFANCYETLQHKVGSTQEETCKDYEPVKEPLARTL